MPGSEFFFHAADGARLLARRWLPDGRPRAIVQIAHGLAEHSARYARLAGALNAAGYGAFAFDLRGHGAACAPADLGHFADADGWAKCVGDLWTFNRLIAAEQPGVPIVLLGHSTGSWIGQQFVSEHSDALSAVVYSGRAAKPPPMAVAGRLIGRAERLRLGGGARAGSSIADVRFDSTSRSRQRGRSPTGCRAIGPKSTPMSRIPSAVLMSPTSLPSTSWTPGLA